MYIYMNNIKIIEQLRILQQIEKRQINFLVILYWVSFGSKKSFDDINNEVDSFWDILIAIFDNPIIIIDDLSLQSLKSDAILNLRNDI